MTLVPNSYTLALEEERDRADYAETECRLLLHLNQQLQKQLEDLQKDHDKAIDLVENLEAKIDDLILELEEAVGYWAAKSRIVLHVKENANDDNG